MQEVISSPHRISHLNDQFTNKLQYEKLWRAKRRNRIDASISHANESLQIERRY